MSNVSSLVSFVIDALTSRPGTEWIYKYLKRNAWDVSNEIDDQVRNAAFFGVIDLWDLCTPWLTVERGVDAYRSI